MDGTLDPFSAQALADPYPVYRQLRLRAPVFDAMPGRWIVTRHADVQSILLDARCAHWGQDPAPASLCSPHERALADVLRLFAPSHPPSTLRRGMNTAFNTAALEGVDRQLGPLCDALLEARSDGHPFDALAGYAHPITMLAVGGMLGLPAAQARGLGEALAAMDGPFFECLRGPGIPPLPPGPARALQGCIDELLAAAEGGGLIGLLRSQAEGREGLLNALLVLIFAAHHNMMNFIGNGLLALALQPQAQAQLREAPALADRAVLELLRRDSPLQYIVLTARESLKLHGRTLARGDEILACVGSANRDEAVFDDPDRLDFTRANAQDLLSFGAGPWRCMGARLALRIGSAAFARVAARGFALAPHALPLQWVHVPIVQRGLAALPLVVRPNE